MSDLFFPLTFNRTVNPLNFESFTGFESMKGKGGREGSRLEDQQ